MSKRNWKRVQPHSLRDALRLCKDHALDKKNYSVERIADLMGITSDLLYKWLANGRMPATSIPAYEHICGINFVTRWLAASTGHLMISIPTGRNASAQDMQQLQEALNTAVGKLPSSMPTRRTRPQRWPRSNKAWRGWPGTRGTWRNTCNLSLFLTKRSKKKWQRRTEAAPLWPQSAGRTW